MPRARGRLTRRWRAQCPVGVYAAPVAGRGWQRCLIPPPRCHLCYPAVAVCVAGCAVRVSHALTHRYAIPCDLCVPRSGSGSPFGSRRMSFVCFIFGWLLAANVPSVSAVLEGCRSLFALLGWCLLFGWFPVLFAVVVVVAVAAIAAGIHTAAYTTATATGVVAFATLVPTAWLVVFVLLVLCLHTFLFSGCGCPPRFSPTLFLCAPRRFLLRL